ncbi:uncharacterized protein LOC122263328 [Penaeus japonicus]|uniref:uncharacterized protein LOC122263328 n=1 Tax=Penaeus japonicus TaxID=27405 RepID=UPI001C70E67B|nr:uncharacterized protein LOC122263328 [Penaeus japonicus]
MGQRLIVTSCGIGHFHLCLILMLFLDLSLTLGEEFRGQDCVTAEPGIYTHLPFTPPFTPPFTLAVVPSSGDWNRFVVYFDADGTSLYHFNVYNKVGETIVSLHDGKSTNLWEEDGLPPVRRSLQLLLRQDRLSLTFEDEGNEEPVTNDEDKDEEVEESTSVSGQNDEASPRQPTSTKDPLGVNTKSLEAKTLHFPLPEIDLSNITGVQLSTVGESMKFCVCQEKAIEGNDATGGTEKANENENETEVLSSPPTKHLCQTDERGECDSSKILISIILTGIVIVILMLIFLLVVCIRRPRLVDCAALSRTGDEGNPPRDDCQLKRNL